MNKAMNLKRSLGAAMLEFAIVLPLLMILFFGIVELGRALYQQNTLYKAVNTGARYLARVNDAVVVDQDEGTCTAGTGWGNGMDRAVELIIQGDGNEPLLPNLNEDGITVLLSARTMVMSGEDKTVCVITIQAQADFAGTFGETIPFTNIGPFAIRAETEERYIGR